MANRFKDPLMRSNYDAAVEMFKVRHRNLFDREGEPHRLSSLASHFWKGYFGETPVLIPRDALIWAHYRAGQACRKEFNVNFKYTGRATRIEKILIDFVKARRQLGWSEGQCDDWLGDLWERAAREVRERGLTKEVME